MRDAAFRREQRQRLYDDPGGGVNRFVDTLSNGADRGWAPHVAPVHGGTRSRLLWILRDPGPKVVDPDSAGTGFLCVENDDPTAERLCTLLDVAGIDVHDTLPWNAYPWFINRAPTAGELRAGVPPLRGLLRLLPDLRVVLLLGEHARRSWELLLRAHPDAADGLMVLRARHPGRQAFIGTPEQREGWRAEQQEVFHEAAAHLASAGPR